MKLGDLIEQIRELDADGVICAKEPWSRDSECKLLQLDEEMRIPQEVTSAGFKYFLDVPVAWEVLEVFGERETTADERINLLIFYAENDAYPDWVYS